MRDLADAQPHLLIPDAYLRNGVFHFSIQGLQILFQFLTGIGQAAAGFCPLEQHHAKLRFQRIDSFLEGRLGNKKLHGSLLHTSCPGSRKKSIKLLGSQRFFPLLEYSST